MCAGGKNGGAHRFSLIFLLLFLSRKKVGQKGHPKTITAKNSYNFSYMISKYNNFYAVFNGISKDDLRVAFAKNYWVWRNESWFDFELTNDWSQIILHGDKEEPLLSGAVVYTPKNIEALDLLFNSLGVSFVYEFYDEEHTLIFERKSNTPLA